MVEGSLAVPVRSQRRSMLTTLMLLHGSKRVSGNADQDSSVEKRHLILTEYVRITSALRKTICSYSVLIGRPHEHAPTPCIDIHGT